MRPAVLAQPNLGTKLAQRPGISPITASALVASIGDAKNFEGGRQLAAWLGPVPMQHSSDGKSNLLGMTAAAAINLAASDAAALFDTADGMAAEG